MKIEITAHNIEMFSKWEKKAVYKREESLDISSIRVKAPGNNEVDRINITPQARDLLSDGLKASEIQKSEAAEEKTISLSEEDKQKILLLEAFLSKLKGKKVKLKIPVLVKTKKGKSQQNSEGVRTVRSWQLNYSLSESYHEKEKISFSSKGIVKTADGKEVDFNIKVKMSREFALKRNLNLSISGGEPVDPIVINYAGNAADFREETFEFDLTADGSKERIPFLKEGSGFLVLAEDGELKDGSQLFGPSTGDGFAELESHDEDNNGWIDSGDSIFKNLKIWTKDENGNDQLFALADKDIGALYLGNIDANYTYKSESFASQAVNKKMSIYLGENGNTGTVQELDLIV